MRNSNWKSPLNRNTDDMKTGSVKPLGLNYLVGFDVKPLIYLYNVDKEFPKMGKPLEANSIAQVKELLS